MPEYRDPWAEPRADWPEGHIVRELYRQQYREEWPIPDPPRRLGRPGMDRTDGADSDTGGDTVPE